MSTFNKNPHPERGVLDEADVLINGPRNKSYGSFSQQAKDVVDIVNIIKRRRKDSGQRPFTDEEIYGWHFVITKVTREATSHKRDNFVDMCGYAELLHRLIEETDKAGAAKLALFEAASRVLKPKPRRVHVVAPTAKWAEEWAQYHKIPRNRFHYASREDSLRGLRPGHEHRVVVIDWSDVKTEAKVEMGKILRYLEHFGPVEYWSSLGTGGYQRDAVKGKSLT